MLRYKDMESMSDLNKMSEEDQNKILHIALPIGKDSILMATDVLESFEKPFSPGNNFYINIEAESGGEADRLFKVLADGGSIEMPLQKTDWAEKYGVCVDKFGVQWMVNFTGSVRFSF